MSNIFLRTPSTKMLALSFFIFISSSSYHHDIPQHHCSTSLSNRHREVAPGQYEFAPLFGTVTTQIDQNLVVMQVRVRVAVIEYCIEDRMQ